MSVMRQYNNLTHDEKAYLIHHPLHSLTIKDATTLAYEETFRNFGTNGRNDKSDAFRHCFWSAILSRELGESNARNFTTAHESSAGNNPKEKKMDLHNNNIGLRIGVRGGSNSSLVEPCEL